MKDAFEDLPHPLRQLILIRSALSGLSVLIFMYVLCYSDKWEFVLGCFLISGVMTYGTWRIFRSCTKQTYVSVQGICTEIDSTWFHKHVKSVTISIDDSQLKLLGVQTPLRSLHTGDRVTAYIAESAAVYDIGGCLVVCSCMALIKEDIYNEG